jgi:biotin carboxylase
MRNVGRSGSSKIIVKPDDGTNSRGFRVIQAHDDIKDAYAHARKFSENRTVIAQKYIEADEQITVEGFCQNGKHITLIASSKGQYWNPSLTSSLRWPAQGVSDSLMKKVFAANDKFVHNTNLTFGITHAEYMLNSQNGEFWLNEIACRGGGFRIGREIIKLATGFDTYEQMYGIQTDKKLPLELPKTPPRGVILQFYSTQDMESVSPWKLSQVQKIPGVFDFNYNFNRQSFMSDPSNIRHTYGIFEANTLDEAESVLYRVNDTMRGN